MTSRSNVVLDDGLDLNQLVTSGSVLNINTTYADGDIFEKESTKIDFIGHPVGSFADLEKGMVTIDDAGLVKKAIREEGGGLPLHKGCTVHIAFSGYWENEKEPFDIRQPDKPLTVDLNDNGLLPGLQTAVSSMLVGELSVFLLSYQVMYGKLGIPPRIKPKANCVFFIKLVKSTLTPKEEKEIKLSEPGMFQRVYRETKLQYSSGVSLHRANNDRAAIRQFKRAEYMLHRCRLADENEEKMQEKMLMKLYLNLACCYNATKQPLKACTACNELNRLNGLWNNPKALYQNARALRMIGQFDEALRRLKRAQKLADHEEIENEIDLVMRMKDDVENSKIRFEKTIGTVDVISDDFKRAVDGLIKSFKENPDLCRLTLPERLNSAESDYIKQACVRDNLFFNNVNKNYALDKDRLDSGEERIDLISLASSEALDASSFCSQFSIDD